MQSAHNFTTVVKPPPTDRLTSDNICPIRFSIGCSAERPALLPMQCNNANNDPLGQYTISITGLHRDCQCRWNSAHQNMQQIHFEYCHSMIQLNFQQLQQVKYTMASHIEHCAFEWKIINWDFKWLKIIIVRKLIVMTHQNAE